MKPFRTVFVLLLLVPLSVALASFPSNVPFTNAVVERRAAEGCPNSQFALGDYLIYIKDFKKGISWLRKSADQDYTSAQIKLGDMYFAGTGVRRDYATALKWYRKVAERQDLPITEPDLQVDVLKLHKTEARKKIADIFEHGLGVRKNHKEAMKWLSYNVEPSLRGLTIKAEQGDAAAQNDVGEFYANSFKGNSPTEAARWFHKAADQGFAKSFYNIGFLYSMKDIYNFSNGKDGQLERTPPKAALLEAAKWYRKAAELGVVDAQKALAEYSYNGREGILPNYEEAYFWLSISYRPCDMHEEELTWRDKAAGHLTPEQKAALDKRLKEWKPAPTSLEPKP